MSLDRHIAHAVVDRAIDQLKAAGMPVNKKTRDALYRMGMVGIMAAYTAREDAIPDFITDALVNGKPLSQRKWQTTLGGKKNDQPPRSSDGKAG